MLSLIIMDTTQILILLLIGVCAGVLSGMFGIGGGLIIVPALVFFMGMTQHEAQGTSIGLMLLPIGILAAYKYYTTGNLDYRAGLIIAGAFVIGAFYGAKISLAIDEILLKRIFGSLMLLVSIKLILFPQS